MDLSASKPMTLRRACQACARGKRRCDQRWPRCSRCQTRRINCEYANVPLTTESPSSLPANAGAAPSIPRPLRMEIVKGYEQRIISLLVTGVSSLPLLFAENMKTHFIHPELWPGKLAPPPIQDVHAICQLYSHSNNTAMLLPLLRQTLAYYHRRISTPIDFEGLLASAQALLLIQCMLIGMENPSIPYSEANHALLLAVSHRLWQQAPIQLPSTLSPRRAWILAESVRRTIIVGFMLRSVYSLKKRNYSVRTPFVDSFPFDVRTSLWDETENSVAGGVGSPADSIVSLHQYSGMLENGLVHGIPPFGGLILAACRGKAVEDIPYPSVNSL